MVANNFYHYKSTRNDSCQKMDRIVHELRSLFDSQGWDERIHPEKLKEKVCNKIHRIRARRGDALAKLRTFLQTLPKDVYPAATQVMLEVFGEDTVRAGLDELNWFDYDGVNQAEASL